MSNSLDVRNQRFPYFLRRGAHFRKKIRHGALSSPLYQRHLCVYLAVLPNCIFQVVSIFSYSKSTNYFSNSK
jgi:hypothetical protein